LKDAIKVLKDNDSFLLVTHLNPDGDALGSALALAEALRAMGKRALVCSRDGVPELINFLPGVDGVIKELPEDHADMVLVLMDCNSLDRAGLNGESFALSLVIDHHATETDFGQVRWVETSAAATGMMVFSLLGELGLDISGDMAVNLYAAIVTDTGAFRFSNTTAKVLEAAAVLVRVGASPSEIAERLFLSWTSERFALFSAALAAMEVRASIAVFAVTLDMHEQTRTTTEDTETFVNFPLTIDDVKVAALLKQREKELWRVSLRSKGEVDVSKVAVEFGGGGHHNAAGCSVTGDLQSAKATIISALTKYI